jgi:hypothetical protein
LRIGLYSGLILLVIVLCFSLKANAQINNQSAEDDIKSVSDKINKSLTELTGANSSDLLKSTMASINNTAQQLANQSKVIINEGSLDTAESIAKKIAVGIADVISNISGEVKQGIESK